MQQRQQHGTVAFGIFTCAEAFEFAFDGVGDGAAFKVAQVRRGIARHLCQNTLCSEVERQQVAVAHKQIGEPCPRGRGGLFGGEHSKPVDVSRGDSRV